jgi:hypothetical protein
MSAPAHPAAAAATAWHLAGSLVSLKAAVDAHWPGRDKRSDGGIGDAAHQAAGSASDHNPWLNNCVRGYDFTVTRGDVHGVDGAWLAEQLRLIGLAGDHRLAGGPTTDDNGYVIFNGHITSPDFSRWVHYSGPDPHVSHVHLSVTRDPGGYEDAGPWTFLAGAPVQLTAAAPAVPAPRPAPQPAPAPAPQLAPVPPAPAGQQVPVVGPHAGNHAAQAPAPVADLDGPEPSGYPPLGADAIGSGRGFRAQFGNEGPTVRKLQAELNRDLAAYAQLDEDGVYGPETAGVLQDFARRVAADPHCPDEHRHALAASHGDNVGPHLAAVFPLYGVFV